MNTTPLPVGQRPKCLACTKELAPNYNRPTPPIWINNEVLTDAQKTQWRKEHPAVFLGNYGRYKDSRFCGLNCGYDYAIRVTRGSR